MRKIAVLLGLLVVASQTGPAFAQYHQNYGNSRVTRQNQTGLFTPSGTYIGAGTMSQSAQGKSAGVGSGLPSVTMGGTIRTPGDNLYNGNGTMRQENGAVIYTDQWVRHQQQQLYKQQMQMMKQQQKQQMQQSGHFYVPGSNGAASSYGGSSSTGYTYNNGVARYRN